MSATDHINKNQLRLFYSASELKDSISGSGDLVNNGTMDDLWAGKLQESKVTFNGEPHLQPHGSNIYRSLEEKGWDGPPLKIKLLLSPKERQARSHRYNNDDWFSNTYQETAIVQDTVGNRSAHEAHHRMAAAADIENKRGNFWIPVTYEEQ